MCNRGEIFNIQRFSTSDGPGIRTVVFLKGCPLHCVWCHNPESQNGGTEIFYRKENCIGCGVCINACIHNNHIFENGIHNFKRNECTSCGKCTQVCYTNALEVCGEEKTAEEIIDIVLRDKPFYEESGGGITLSGGEPLMQYDFSLSLLKLAKKHNLHTAIETSGFSKKSLYELNEYTDIWLYDIKLFPEEEHIKYTGASNDVIFRNLYFLDSIGAKIVLRCPLIPNINLNAEHINKLANLANSLKNIIEMHLEPYHPLGISKAQQLNKTQNYQNNKFLEPSAIQPFSEVLSAKTDIPIIIL